MNQFRFERTVGRLDLLEWGPRFGVDVGLPQPAAGGEPKTFVNLSAMIDSGARDQ
jgi:hypothetical protein